VPETQLLTTGEDATLEFHTETDDVSVSGGSVTADGFSDAVNTANADLGTSAPAVDASAITVSDASESTSSSSTDTKAEDSGASSTVPTLLAGCLVVATALFTKA